MHHKIKKKMFAVKRSSHFDDAVEFLSVVGRRAAAARQLKQSIRQSAVIELADEKKTLRNQETEI